MLRHIVVGTAGHIDHGKTRLVRCLTGVDTDRLPEERARGISIDLGFAHFRAPPFEFEIVDVPGHERFIRNMVAGATGIDLALLVVAADDGVMPQTREHLEILDLLGVSAGVVGISKTDLVEPEFVELVRAELEEVLSGTFLETAPVVPFSAQTGAGIDELRESLVQVAAHCRSAERLPYFRLPIDRVFSVPGHGTVVTGTTLSGSIHPGEQVEILPTRVQARVRGVQSHGQDAPEGNPGQRTAINLAGVRLEELHRGMELATPGFVQPSTRLLVRLHCLSRSPVPLKDRQQLRLHLGTGETTARLVIKGDSIAPGSSGFAELRTREPVVAVWGQNFILRRLSPEMTLGGGTILDPAVPPGRRVVPPAEQAVAYFSDDPGERLSAWLATLDVAAISPLSAGWKVGVFPGKLPVLLDQLERSGALVRLGTGIVLHRDRLDRLKAGILRRVRDELRVHQPRRSLPRKQLLNACRGLAEPAIVELVFDRLLSGGELVPVGENIGPADAQARLTKNQALLRSALLEAVASGGLSPPTLKEVAVSRKQTLEEVQTVATVCLEDGLLVDLGENLCFTPQALERARQIAKDAFSASPGPLTLSQLREAWGTSRKYAIPLGQYFDAHGLTIREGDLRHPGPRLDTPRDG